MEKSKNTWRIVLAVILIIIALIIMGAAQSWMSKNNLTNKPVKLPELPYSAPDTIATKIDLGMSAKGIKIIPLEVVEDSRCAKDVQCVWPGTVKVRTEVQSDLGITKTVFTLGQTLTIDGAEIRLVKVSPDKEKAGESIPLSRYEFKFEIGK